VKLGEILYSTDVGKSPNCVGSSINDDEWGVIKITAIQIHIPTLDKQKRIVGKVNQLMIFCDELEKNIKQSKQDSE
jgi:hypothetical protein